MRSTSLPLRPPLYPLRIAVRPTSVAAEGGALEEGARRPSQPRGGAAQLGLDTPRYASPPLPPSLPRRGSDLAPLPQGLLRPPRRPPRRTSTPTAGRRSKGGGSSARGTLDGFVLRRGATQAGADAGVAPVRNAHIQEVDDDDEPMREQVLLEGREGCEWDCSLHGGAAFA